MVCIVMEQYRCQYCGAQGLFDQMKKHSEEQHPDAEVKVVRLTAKKRSSSATGAAATLATTSAASVSAAAATAATAATSAAAGPESFEEEPPAKKAMAYDSSGGADVVFVVAQPQPQYVCHWCQVGPHSF